MTSRKRILVKIGGNAMGGGDTTVEDLVWLQAEGHRPVVIHGGGKTITQWLERMAVPTRFVDGLRVTDEQSIDVVVGVLAGAVNKLLVASINAAGGRAVGVSGADGATLRARVKDPKLGLVGEVVRVEPALLESLLGAGYVPVVSPIGVLEGGGALTPTLLNVNADTAAAAIGAALCADTFVFMTDVPGVLGADGDVVPRLSQAEARTLILRGVIQGGMIPKVEACLMALEKVSAAVVLDGRRSHALRDLVAGEPVGTHIE